MSSSDSSSGSGSEVSSSSGSGSSSASSSRSSSGGRKGKGKGKAAPAKKGTAAAKGKAAKGKKARGKGARGEKKRKDPNAPKKPASAYLLFSVAKRHEVVAANPGLAFGDVGKKISELWKALTADDKKEWDAKAAVEKARYEREKAAYQPAESDEDGPPRKKAKKDPNAPKKAQTAYFVFTAQFRKTDAAKGLKVTEVSKAAGSKWGTMGAEEKKPYEELAKADKERYEREIAAYKNA